MIDANFTRICKLALVSGGVSLCAAGAAFLVEGNLRQLAAGATAGLTLGTMAMLVGTYRRRGLLDASLAKKEKRARRAGPFTTTGMLLGAVAVVPVRLLHTEWLAAGVVIGIFVFLALMFSPLFWTRLSPLVETSPRARMTSAERAVGVRYE